MRITRRLGVLVAVPLAAVSGFGAVALTASAGETMRGQHLWSLMHTATAAGQLICQLQDERTMMALLLTSADPRPTPDVEAQIAQTDAAISVFRQQVRALPHTPQVTRDLLTRIDEELTQLTTLRTRIRAQAAPALSAVAFHYRIAIADLGQFREAVASAGSAPQQISAHIHAANLLYQAAEATGLEESDVLRSATGQPLTPAAVAAIARDRQNYDEAMEAFDTQAPAEWHERPDEAMTTPDILTAQQHEDQISRMRPGDTLKLDKGVWARAMSSRRDALDAVREELDLATLSAIAELRDSARRTAETEAAAIAGTALLVVMISLRLGRPMIRGLRQLRDAAHAVAFERLPAAVEELRATESLTGRSPEEFADQAGDALTFGRHAPGSRRRDPIRPDDSKDELAAVAKAFNSVHHEALRTAAEQVLLRAGVGATFVALARRGERLTGALTSELDRAERAEQDPDRLARLFVLDHLAARMTRNNESLLVLGGEGTARVRDRGVALLDVARAALGRIERYTKVDLETVEDGIVVAPQAVDHLVHLCAELLDNATTFSQPGSRVTFGARRMADRVIIQIADRGIGITPSRRAELNARLAAPRQVDSETVRAMGLTVVAHLAAWYGIEVELRARPGGGTVAEVALPLDVVTPSQDPDSQGATVGRVDADTGGIKDATPISALGEPPADEDAAYWPELPFADETEETAGTATVSVPDLAEYRPPVDAGRPAAAYTALASRLEFGEAIGTGAGESAFSHSAAANDAAPSHAQPSAQTAAEDQASANRGASAHAGTAEQAPAGGDLEATAHAIASESAFSDSAAANGASARSGTGEQASAGGTRAASAGPSTPVADADSAAANAQPSAQAAAENPASASAESSPAAAPDPAATTGPEPTEPAAPPTTLNGLPVRIPQTKLPKEARRGAAARRDPDPPPDPAAAPGDRDPERVAATMAAYARGLIGGRGGPKP